MSFYNLKIILCSEQLVDLASRKEKEITSQDGKIATSVGDPDPEIRPS
jgi:hypothetical protein